jgi:hypothetical protein
MAPTDRRKPGLNGDAQRAAQKPAESTPPELSSRGKVVIRSSSHPPGSDLPITDPPPAEMLAIAEALREKKDTPAEGPRGRRKVQAKRISDELAAVAAREAEDAAARARQARGLARARSRDTRLWWTVIGLGALAALLHWLAR